MLGLGADREIRRGGEPRRLCESGAQPSRPRHHGGLRATQEREREAARQRPSRSSLLRLLRPGKGRFKPVVAPEQPVADGERGRAEQPSRRSLLSARPCRTSRAMITRTILHALWAVIVFVFAVTVALGVLFMLGAAWV